MKSVLLADDHSIVIEGLRRVLDPTYTVLHAVADGRAMVDAARALKPDVIIADVSMPILNGIEAVRQVRQTNQLVKIVFYTMHSDVVYASEALQAGGSAYILKSSAAADILTAMREVLAGRIYVAASLDPRALESQIQRNHNQRCALDELPPRQREVVTMAAEGQSTKRLVTPCRFPLGPLNFIVIGR